MPSVERPTLLDTPLGKALRALELISNQDGDISSLETLAQAMALPLTATRRILRTLVDHGLLIESPDESSYCFGPRSIRLSNLIQRNLPLGRLARPIMQSLVSAFDETVTLNAYLRLEGLGICVAVEECNKPMQYVLEPGEFKRLHSGAAGKSILAFLPDDAVERVIKRNGLESVTDRTVTNRTALARDLEKIRRDGVAVTRGERINGAVGIGAPILDGMGHVVASLTMTIPEVRCSQALIAAARQAVRSQAYQLSSMLGAGSEAKSVEAPKPVTRRRRRS
ncbi:MAG: IclR family transcriptional regulator [Pseudolabrys sp.]|nr:IclR family transcriptional regulator [Pseudolabrys sp.]